MTVEEIVARIMLRTPEAIDSLNYEHLDALIRSWRERGEALKAIEETLADIGIGNLNASLVHLRALARVRGSATGPEDVVRMPPSWVTTIGAP